MLPDALGLRDVREQVKHHHLNQRHHQRHQQCHQVNRRLKGVSPSRMHRHRVEPAPKSKLAAPNSKPAPMPAAPKSKPAPNKQSCPRRDCADGRMYPRVGEHEYVYVLYTNRTYTIPGRRPLLPRWIAVVSGRPPIVWLDLVCLCQRVDMRFRCMDWVSAGEGCGLVLLGPSI